MKKLIAALALSIALPALAYAQPAPPQKKDCCEEMRAKGKKCCCEDMIEKGHGGHDKKGAPHDHAPGAR